MRLSVIVVTLRAGESLLACLASIERALQRVDGATEIVLIDNGAPAEAIAALRARFPAVRVLGLGHNQGFAEAINHGLQATSGEWLLLLNDDTTTEPDAVAELLHAAQDRPTACPRRCHVGRNRVRLLTKHLPTAHLLRYGAAITAYDVAYIVVAGLSDRTLAPLSGRLRGLREWRRYRRLGRDRRPVALAAVQGPRGALARRRAFSDRSYRP